MPKLADRFIVNVGGNQLHLPSVVLTIVLSGLAGFAAQSLGAPLPWLLGALIVTAGAGLMGLKPIGHTLGVPVVIRTIFIPVIGVSIGAAFTPSILQEAAGWWPTLLALFLYIPLAHGAGFLVATRLGGADPPTAYYGMMPGGFVESIPLGEAAGADIALLSTLQFLRLTLLIVSIPIGFSFFTGNVVGSATGEVIGGDAPALDAADWIILIAAGLIGGLGGRWVGIPAGIITGPILTSGLVHILGLVEGGPPVWLISITQLVIGASIGARFAGRSPTILWTGLKIVVMSVAAMLVVASAFSAVFHRLVDERWETVFLAFAPGGLVEMALIALSLQVSVLYVTGHHVFRIILAVMLARAFERFVIGPQR